MANWNVGVALLLAIASVMAAQAQQGLKPARLTASDHIEIQQLVARFSHALNTAVDTGETFASLFTADGTYGTSTGRVKLAALARDIRKENANLRHFITNILIHPTATGASGTQYELVFGIGRGGKQSEIVRTGRYEDAYVKTAQGWRFKKREFTESTPTSAASKAAVPQSPQSGPQAAIIVAPQRSGTRTSLTEMDYLEIQQLVASYGHALDNGLGRADNGDAYAGLFTPDGVAFRRLKGHEELAAIARAQPHGVQYVRHFLTNGFVKDTSRFNFPSVAAFLDGMADSFIVTPGDRSYSVSQSAIGGFVQDNYKWRPKITLEMGLRYDWNMTPTERFNRSIVFDEKSASLARVTRAPPSGKRNTGHTSSTSPPM